MASVVVLPFVPSYYTPQELNCEESAMVTTIPSDFMKAVSNRIDNFDVYRQVVANLGFLNPASLETTNMDRVRFEISRLLFNISNCIYTDSDTEDNYCNVEIYTPDLVRFNEGIVLYESIKICASIQFVKGVDGISARFRVVFKKGLSSRCDLLMMTITHPAY